MTEKLRYKAFKYRIVLDIENEIEEHDDSKLNVHENYSNIKCQSNCFTLQLNPKKCIASSSGKNCMCTSNIKLKSKRTALPTTLDKPIFSSDSVSSDSSFYTCKSYISVSGESQEVNCMSEKDSDNGEEICSQIIVKNKVFCTNKLHKTTPKTYLRKNIPNETTGASLVRSADSNDKYEKYKMESGVSKNGASVQNINLRFVEEHVSCEEMKVIIEKLKINLNFATWELICKQSYMIKTLRLQTAGQIDRGTNISYMDSSQQTLSKLNNKDMLLPISGSLKEPVFSGKGDFSEKDYLSNNTIKQLRETFFIRNSNKSCLMMLMKKSIEETHFGKGIRLSQLKTLQEQSALLLHSNKNKAGAVENTQDKIFPVFKSSENNLYTHQTQMDDQDDGKNEEEALLSSLNKKSEHFYHTYQSGNTKHETKFQTKRNFVKKDNVFEKTPTTKHRLPMIKEESLESLCSDFEEELVADNYCLVDGEERPIRLFDFNGFPLTDHSGRPLKDVKGNLLMNCDGDGIPIVDFDNCNIFDMFGNRPDDEDFNPSAAPEARINKVFASSVVLYDVDGNPLTSVSGTPLVDACGQSLISQDNFL